MTKDNSPKTPNAGKWVSVKVLFKGEEYDLFKAACEVVENDGETVLPRLEALRLGTLIAYFAANWYAEALMEGMQKGFNEAAKRSEG